MKKQLRKTFWGMLIVLAAMLAVSLTVGLTAGPGWAATTGVRIVVKNESMNKGFIAEYTALDGSSHEVEILDPNGFASFSSEATAWFAKEKTYRYKVNIYSLRDQENPCGTANLTLRNIWDMGPKVESCEVQVVPGRSGKSCFKARAYKNSYCNLKIEVSSP